MSTLAIDPRPITAPRTEDAEDRALLVAVRAGDEHAMAELYRRYRDDVHRFAGSLTRDGSADEVVSESFARMLRAIRNGAGPHDHPRRYLFVTARTVVMSMSIREQRRGTADRSFAAGAPRGTPTGVGVAEAAMHEAFNQLSHRQRLVLWMAEVEDRPATEIGAALGISPGAVYALGLRSRRALRRTYLHALAHSDATHTPAQPTGGPPDRQARPSRAR